MNNIVPDATSFPSVTQVQNNNRASQQPLNESLEQYQSNLKNYQKNVFSKGHLRILKTVILLPRIKQFQVKYPMFKIIRNITNFYTLTEFELLLFSYSLVKIEPPFNNNHVSNSAQLFLQDFLNLLSTKLIENTLEYKKLLLWILVLAYVVKQESNSNSMQIYQAQITTIMSLKEFMEIKEVYSPIIKELICNITINQLNTIIHEYGMFSQNNFTDDFNAMVDGIIDISPAYNIDARYDQTSSSRPHSDMDKKVKKVKTDDLCKESKKERNEIYFYEKPERSEKQQQFEDRDDNCLLLNIQQRNRIVNKEEDRGNDFSIGNIFNLDFSNISKIFPSFKHN